jgi:hypothetical protein
VVLPCWLGNLSLIFVFHFVTALSAFLMIVELATAGSSSFAAAATIGSGGRSLPFRLVDLPLASDSR